MHKMYYIDSENVGDNWVSLLNAAAPEDEILVFYTAKSPHMNYKNIVLLKQSQKEVTFIECCEGNNALDFQLCTDLGYRIHEMADNEYIIVSNDTGYDAVVKYWRRRNIFVKRIPGKACSTLLSIMPEPALPAVNNRVPDSCTAPPSATTPFSATPTVSTMPQTSTDAPKLSDTFDFSDIAVDSDKETTSSTASAISADEAKNSTVFVSSNEDAKDPTVSAVSSEDVKSSTVSVSSNEDAKNTTVSAVPSEDAKGSSVSVSSNEDAKDSTVSAVSSEEAKDSTVSVIPAENDKDFTTSAASTEAVPKPKNTSNVMDVRAKEILYILGKENLQDLHESLQQLFGSKKGQSYYNSFKSDTSFNNYINKHQKLSPVEKQNSYCSIVFDLSDTKLDMPEDFSSFVADTWKKKKNLNSFRASLQSKYGKDKSDKYYSLIKAHVKILDKIK